MGHLQRFQLAAFAFLAACVLLTGNVGDVSAKGGKGKAGSKKAAHSAKKSRPSVQKSTPPKVHTASRKREPQKLSDHQLTKSLASLESLQASGIAGKDIGKAENSLKKALESRGIPLPKAPASVEKLSPQQLAAKIPQLEQTLKTLKEADHDYDGHRAAAVRDLEATIKQAKEATQTKKS
jgi:hypothetical protein